MGKMATVRMVRYALRGLALVSVLIGFFPVISIAAQAQRPTSDQLIDIANQVLANAASATRNTQLAVTVFGVVLGLFSLYVGYLGVFGIGRHIRREVQIQLDPLRDDITAVKNVRMDLQARYSHYYGYLSWKSGDPDDAIRFSEGALELIERSEVPDKELTANVKNNLAYFYAWKPLLDKKQRALDFANTVADTRQPIRPYFLGTQAFVHATFAETQEQFAAALLKMERVMSMFPETKAELTRALERLKQTRPDLQV